MTTDDDLFRIFPDLPRPLLPKRSAADIMRTIARVRLSIARRRIAVSRRQAHKMAEARGLRARRQFALNQLLAKSFEVEMEAFRRIRTLRRANTGDSRRNSAGSR